MQNERLALLLILLLSALLAVPAKGAVPPAAVTSSAAPGLAHAFGAPVEAEAEAEGEEAEEGGEEAAEGEEGCEAGEVECEAEEGGEGECLLAGAQATVAANPRIDRLRVSIRYTAFQPATVAVTYQLGGGANPLHLGSAQAHFARKGVFHDNVAIGAHALAKVLAAREVTIGLHAINTPGYCAQALRQHLAPRRSGNRLLFS